jgi:hypothetical protein
VTPWRGLLPVRNGVNQGEPPMSDAPIAIPFNPARAEATNRSVGLNVATAMVSRAISLDALASSIGVTPEYLRACFKGKGRLRPGALIAASQRLHVSMAMFFSEGETSAGQVIH